MLETTDIDPVVQSIDRATIAGVVRAALGAAAGAAIGARRDLATRPTRRSNMAA